MDIVDFDAPWRSPDWVQWTKRIAGSYERLLGKQLICLLDGSVRKAAHVQVSSIGQAEQHLTRALFEAPFALLAHNTASDPIFVYGNRTALGLWEVDLGTLLRMPSRASAEPQEQQQRGTMLQRGLERGFIEDYGGVRISATGRRFHIEGATIWNVFDETGERRIGQAAMFARWRDCV